MTPEQFMADFNLKNEPKALIKGKKTTDFTSILRPFKQKSGIYGWVHEGYNRIYIGSAKNLFVRPCKHLYPSTKGNMYLKNAFKKHGLGSFTLVILEVLGEMNNVTDVQRKEAEDKYLPFFLTKYNVLTKAFTSSGYVHTLEVRQQLSDLQKGRFLSEETKQKRSVLISGQNNPFFGKKHTNELKLWLKTRIQGKLNPMYGKEKSTEFKTISVQKALKPGAHNPMSKAILLTNYSTDQQLEFETKISAANFFGYKSKTPINNALKNKTFIKDTMNHFWSVQLKERKE